MCDNPLYVNLRILHPETDDMTFSDSKVLDMKYYWAYVKHSRTPKPPRGHALAVQDRVDVFDMKSVSHGQPFFQYPFCRDVVSFHKFRGCPQFAETIKAGLAYRTGKPHHRWNPDGQEFKDPQQVIANARHRENVRASM